MDNKPSGIKLGDLIALVTKPETTLMVCCATDDGKCRTFYHGDAGLFKRITAISSLGAELIKLSVAAVNSCIDEDVGKAVICIGIDPEEFLTSSEIKDIDSYQPEPPTGDPADDCAIAVEAIVIAINTEDIQIVDSPEKYRKAVEDETVVDPAGFIADGDIFMNRTAIGGICASTGKDLSFGTLMRYMKARGIFVGSDHLNGTRYPSAGEHVFFRLSAAKLGVKLAITNTDPVQAEYSFLNIFHFTRYFVDWAMRAKPTTISTKEFCKVFKVSEVKARKVMNRLVDLDIMSNNETKCKPRTVNLDKVKDYKAYFDRYECCRFCVNYGESPLSPKANCKQSMRPVIGEIGVNNIECAHFFMDENKVHDYNEAEGIETP